MRKKMNDKGDEIKKIKGAFQHMLHEYKLDSRYTATVIKASWEKIMGKPIASRTSQISLKNGKLRVRLTSAPLKNELNMSKSKILELIEKEFGKGVVKEIIFI
jgi:predicted nucleic acid-binding Zn ribbon protein